MDVSCELLFFCARNHFIRRIVSIFCVIFVFYAWSKFSGINRENREEGELLFILLLIIIKEKYFDMNVWNEGASGILLMNVLIKESNDSSVILSDSVLCRFFRGVIIIIGVSMIVLKLSGFQIIYTFLINIQSLSVSLFLINL